MPARIAAIGIAAIAVPPFAPVLRPPLLLAAPPPPPGGVPVLLEQLLEAVPLLEGRNVSVPVPWGPA
jgi:hypothetical protein